MSALADTSALFADSSDDESPASTPFGTASTSAVAEAVTKEESGDEEEMTAQQRIDQHKSEDKDPVEEEEEEDDDDEDAMEQDDVADDINYAGVPDSLTEHRACKRCGLIKTFTQFYDYGCENCPFFEMEEDNQKVIAITSSFFAGAHGITDCSESWMAKWMHLKESKAGIYASSIQGSLPQYAVDLCEQKGYKWRAKVD